MKILGFQKTTLLDFPGHIASMIFTAGCNLRCPYCQNSELILPDAFDVKNEDSRDGAVSGPISEDELFSYLKSHIGRIEGLVITGGEPTLQPDLVDFCRRIKKLGLSIKLDTNGINPYTISTLLDGKLVDYIALDVKLPLPMYELLLPEHASESVKSMTIENLWQSLDILKNLSDTADYETRTTVADEFFDERIIDALGRTLSGIKRHYLQPYRDADTVLMRGLHTPSDEKLIRYRTILRQYVPDVEIRGVDL